MTTLSIAAALATPLTAGAVEVAGSIAATEMIPASKTMV